MALPPGPSGNPLSIAWYLLRTIRDPHGLTAELAGRYGDTFTVPSAQGPLVVTGDPAGIETLFTADVETVGSQGGDLLNLVVGDRSVLALDGEEHRRARRRLNPPFHGSRMPAYGQLMQRVTR